jgi:hypothetical protein
MASDLQLLAKFSQKMNTLGPVAVRNKIIHKRFTRVSIFILDGMEIEPFPI